MNEVKGWYKAEQPTQFKAQSKDDLKIYTVTPVWSNLFEKYFYVILDDKGMFIEHLSDINFEKLYRRVEE